MTKLILPSQVDPVVKPSELEQRIDGDVFKTLHSVTFQINRGEGEEHVLDVDDTDVVELEMEDGQKLWVRVDDLESEFGVQLNRSNSLDETGTIRIQLDLPVDGRTRGFGKWVIKGLKIIGVDIAGSISEFVAGKVEGKLSPGPGLYRCTAGSAEALQPVAAIDRSKPVLVFLHGTASSTDGSFGALWKAGGSAINELLNHYGDQVLAFQHQTLSLSPVENALALLKELSTLPPVTVQGKHPPKLKLHLVSHSRGGLVGELLCRGTREGGAAFDDIDINFFSDAEYARDKAALQELGNLLDQSALQIDKFIRVACPARGTTLADGRLDRYFSGLVNIIEKVPGLANPVVDGISSLLLAVVHKRTEPEELPGLEAMMPTSPTIRMLNRPDISINADLHVIGGDVKASGFINRLKVIITDLFYREDHDLVVNTPSMFGGAPRSDDVRYWVDTGSNVNHFNYFGNSGTASRLTTGLLHNDAAFRTLDVKPFEVNEDSYRKRTIEPQPIVFVLPGIMGSHLTVDNDRVWLDFMQLARGGISRLGIDKRAPKVQAEKPLDLAYGELLQFLAASHDVRPFAYDWRLSLQESSRLLRDQVEEALDKAVAMNQPIRFIAHSMGGLVVRMMLATPEGDTLWKRICEHPGARFIMLGTPNGGSHSMVATLLGRDAMVRKLALLDFRNNYADLLQTIVRFDGALQLLPHQGTLDLYDVANWQRLHDHDVPEQRGVFKSKVASNKSAGISWQIPDQDSLNRAAQVRDLLKSTSVDPKRTIYVAGVAPATAIDVKIDESARSGRQVQVHATAAGDGSVVWSTGIPANLPERNVYYMDAPHGDLADTPDTFPALLELLETGATRQLSSTPLVSRGLENERFIMPPPQPDMYPTHEDLVATLLGGRRADKKRPSNKCKVRIVHGDLARSRFPVTVGHYGGDTIVSAEAYLDRQVHGRLRERNRLGMYPARIGSSIVMLNWPDEYERNRNESPIHPGAIVVGLGTVGDLTPGDLTSTLVDGLMRYALEVRDTRIERSRQADKELPPTIEAPLSALLISSGNDLNVSDSLRSILRAVAIVNSRLNPLADDDALDQQEGRVADVRISELDIVEYWEDRAIQATRALMNLESTNEFSEKFEFHAQVVEGLDGRRRASFDDQAGWWQRLRISTLDNDDLKFETLTERARVESQLQSTQRVLVDRFLARAASSTQDKSLGKTLFELLMPNQLKEYAPDRRNLILMLDDKASAYPWELLQDGSDASGRPMAVESGVVRQLISGEFRAQPLMSQELTALVVGDPVADDDNSGAFPPLPGAAAEAQEVAVQLNAANYNTVELVGKAARPLDVVTALYSKAYRIVHIAAHGVFQLPVDDKGKPLRHLSLPESTDHSTQKCVTGVVLGDGIYLTPAEFEQMRNVPELVFINCCHLGNQAKSDTDESVQYHRLAANVATQLIRMGVRAVVAAGWAVDDAAAKLFAETFYKRLLAGNTFGESVATARSEAYDMEKLRSGNTWGAYQCYGDPDFSLRERDGYRASAKAEKPFSPAEVKQQLEDLRQSLGYSPDAEKLERVGRKLETLVEVIPDKWMESGSVCSAIAGTFARLGKLEQAASYYQKANASPRADASIVSLEQLVNMKARLAVEMTRDPSASKENKDRALKELAEAQRIIDSLIALNPSHERYALKGSVHKRMAVLASKSLQRAHLSEMADAYTSAHEAGLKGKQDNVFYSLQNSLAARITLLWCDGVKKPPESKQIISDLDQLTQYMNSADMRGADFWTACQEPDLFLLKALSNNRILSQSELSDIERGYQRARLRGSSELQIKTIREHLGFFLTIASTQLPKTQKATKNLCSGIERLIESLDTV